MKKYLAILVVLTMAASGCATFQSILNSGPVNFMCNPDASQQATATAMLAALDAAQAAGAIFVPALAIAKASAVLRTIQAGGCFLVAELREAFETVDAGNQAVALKRMKALPTAAPALPEYKPLRDLVK